jgi:acyl-CoA carboxylase subunit beta
MVAAAVSCKLDANASACRTSAMTVLDTKIDPRAETFRANYAGMAEQIRILEEQLAVARAGGGEKYVSRHRARGKLLPRERIELLLDRDAPFLELSPLAGWGTDYALGAGVVTGIGVVSGVECVLTANDPTMKGGATNPITMEKNFRAMDIAATNRLPLINLTESAGADLPHQAKIFVPGGRTFRELTQRSAERIPTVCLVFGSSTAGGAYVPGMSDYVVMVKGGAKVFLAGPPLVKMATNEDTDEESLGGAEMHSRVSGVSDYLAENEIDAIRLGRAIVSHLNWRKLGGARMQVAEEPKYDPDELLGIASMDVRKPFEVREVIARIVDGSRFEEFKANYGTTLVTGWAHLHGYPIGILANNGILFSDSSQKAAQFIQLCNKIDVPLLFLQNITGYMVGKQYEQGGIIKDGAKMINAVSNSTVPAFTLMIGSSYGAGNYGMCGRAYDPRFLFTWPNHRIAVMGPEQLAGVMSIVRRTAAERAGQPYNEEEDQVVRRMVTDQIDQESNAFYATGRVWDDGIIDPRDSRTVLGIALSAAFTNVVKGTDNFGVFRM